MSKQREGDHSAGYRTSLPFPPEIAVSGIGSRPDGVIWSMSCKTVIWIELASPWEENMSKRHFEKKNKYNQLALDLRNPHRVGGAWTVFPFEVEVGARGAINEQPWSYMCSKLGFIHFCCPSATQVGSARCCTKLQPSHLLVSLS